MSWSDRVNWQTEPLAIIGLTKAILEVGAGAGLQISGSTTAAIVADVTAVVTVLATFFGRSKVSSPATKAAAQAQTDAHLAAASEALANAGPDVQNRARLCPTGPSVTYAPGTQMDWATNYVKENYVPTFDDPADHPTASGIHAHPSKKLGLAPHGKAQDELLHVGWRGGVIPTYEPAVDRLSAITIGLLGNDTYGDCEEVSCANHDAVNTHFLTGHEIDHTEAETLALYAASTKPPFNPTTGANDNGTDMVTGMKALQQAGIGGRKIVAYAKLKDTSDESIYAAIDIFGAVIFAVDLQTAQQTQSDTWDYKNSPEWGGHAIVAGRYDAASGIITVGSWGKQYGTTKAFRTHQLDEVWVPIWPELLGASRFVGNVDTGQLAADFRSLTGGTLPTPAPVPTPPAPGPAPTPPVPSDASFLVAEDLLSHMATAAKRAGGITVDQWLNDTLHKHFKMKPSPMTIHMMADDGSPRCGAASGIADIEDRRATCLRCLGAT